MSASPHGRTTVTPQGRPADLSWHGIAAELALLSPTAAYRLRTI